MNNNRNQLYTTIKYRTDTGSRDLSTEKKYDADTPFQEVFRKAIELGAYVIVRTKTNSWYIKGYNNKHQQTYNEIKDRIIYNKLRNYKPNSTCWLIKYL